MSLSTEQSFENYWLSMRNDRPDARNLLQLARQYIGAMPRLAPYLHLAYLPVQFLEMRQQTLRQLLHQFPECARQLFVFRFVEQYRYALVKMHDPLRHDQSEFT